MIAAVTDLHGAITGVHRTWLEPATCTKAQITNPRRAMGGLLGNGVRFGLAGPVMLAAEGIETTLSLRQVLPDLPMIACLSAAHLAAVNLPPALRRLYVGCDNDTAGENAMATLQHRVAGTGIEVIALPGNHDAWWERWVLGRMPHALRGAHLLRLLRRGGAVQVDERPASTRGRTHVSQIGRAHV